MTDTKQERFCLSFGRNARRVLLAVALLVALVVLPAQLGAQTITGVTPNPIPPPGTASVTLQIYGTGLASTGATVPGSTGNYCVFSSASPVVTVNGTQVTVVKFTATEVDITVPPSLLTPPSVTIVVSVTYYTGAIACSSGSTSTTVTVAQPQKAVPVITLATNPNPSICATVTLTATVSGNASSPYSTAPTGSVTFYDGSTGLGTVNLAPVSGSVSATATLQVPSLSAGSHSLTAVYSGDTNYASNTSNMVNQVVNEPSVSLVASPNPATVGQPATLTATISPNPGAGIVVTFQQGGVLIDTKATDANGVATLTTTALIQGNLSLVASYNSTCGTVSSAPYSERVNASGTSTTTTLSVSPAQPNVCQPLTLTATVTPPAAGTVTFLDVTKGKPGTTLKSSVNVTVGSTSATAGAQVPLPAGTFALEADFTPSAPTSFGSSSGTANATVIQAPTTTQLTPQPVTSSPGQSVTLTATVAGCGASNPITPTGTVKFTDGSTTINTATLNGSAVATLSTSFQTTGNHALTAIYSGDPNYTTSSGTATETVGLPSTTTSLNASPNPSTYGQPVTLTATVTPSTATGNVTFSDGTVQLGQATVTGGKATFTLFTLTGGSHPLTATYNGDTSDAASTSPSVSLTVNKAATASGLHASSFSLTQGQTVTLTATVTPPGATGTVTFTDGSTSLGQQPLSGGQATLTTSALAVGGHQVTASYGGDANYLGSSSGTVNISVSSGLQISSPALSSSPPTKLPAGTMNAPYSQTFSAAGGTPPYSWSLPQSDTSDLQIGAASGVLSGTPKTTGTFNLTVQVQDSASPQATIKGAYQVTVNYPALPTISLAVDKQPQTPLDQPTPTLTLGQQYGVQLSGTVTLSFAPNAAGLPATGYTNKDLVFLGGGSSTTVPIPAGSTTISLPKIQVGTVAGTITATLGPLTPAGSSQALPFTGPVPSITITLNPMKPLLSSVKIANATSSGFQVVIAATSTTRDLSLAELVFTSASGTQLNGTTSFTGSSGVSLSTAAPVWFSSTKTNEGVDNGGAFTLTIPFVYSGDPTALGTVQATLTNSLGKSDPMSGGK